MGAAYLFHSRRKELVCPRKVNMPVAYTQNLYSKQLLCP